MIVARGLGRGKPGALVASGLGANNAFLVAPLLVNEQAFYELTIAVGQPPSGGGGILLPGKARRWPRGSEAADIRDLSEILPIVIGALNASRTH